MKEKIAVIGLGYVGLPVALALAEHFEVVGFDIKKERIAELQAGKDSTHEVEADDLQKSTIKFSLNPNDLTGCTMFIVTVPTPIDQSNRPDLRPLEGASKTIAPYLTRGALVVYESTVYPGVTEEYCAPILEKLSNGLQYLTDFNVGYSPERINPGDKQRRLANITKIIAGDSPESLARMNEVYGKIITAGLYHARTIKIAEAAKVIENTQRDINIALINELAIIFDKLDIPTREVLEAAKTKWNWRDYTPGLVGGHCIGVDPYYLTNIAERHGVHPKFILAGREINESMPKFVAQKAIKLLKQSGRHINGAKFVVWGITFKENVPDCRNSKVPDIIMELEEFGCNTIANDPLANHDEVLHEYNIALKQYNECQNADVLIIAVAHDDYKSQDLSKFLKKGGVLIDVKSLLNRDDCTDYNYWSL